MHRLLQKELYEYFKVNSTVNKLDQIQTRFAKVVEDKFYSSTCYYKNIHNYITNAHAVHVIFKRSISTVPDRAEIILYEFISNDRI